MTYLPNSIERCTPILGYDPYAFIMDKPSNLRINKMQSPYDVDYFAVGPDKAKTEETKENKEKNKNIAGTILKVAAGLTAIALVGYGIKKGIDTFAASGGSGLLTSITGHIRNAGRCALNTLSSGCNFASRQLTRFANFIQSRITPPTPPAPPSP